MDSAAQVATSVRVLHALALVGGLLGVALRARVFVQHRSLWLDELMLSLNVPLRSVGALLTERLLYEQTAPPLYLVAVKASTALFGVSERSLWAVSFAAGLAVLPLTWVLARRIAAETGATLATLLVATAPPLVLFSAQAKPYSFEVFVDLVLVLLALRLTEQPGVRGRWLAMTAAGVVGVAAAPTAVFVLCAIALELLLEVATSQRWRRRIAPIAGMLVLWAVAFATVYAAMYQQRGATAAFVRRFWAGALLGDQVGAGLVIQVVRAFLDPLVYSPDTPSAALKVAALVAITVGAAYLAARGRTGTVVLLLGPTAAACAASLVTVYPLSFRFVLFGAPLVATLIAAGVAHVARRVARPVLVAVVAAAPFVVLTLPAAVAMVPGWESGGANSKVVDELLASSAAGDVIYVNSMGIPAWSFYTTDWSKPDLARVGRLALIARQLGPNSGNAPPRGRAVVGEGDSLVLAYRDRATIIGVPPGVELLGGPVPAPRTEPDPGWADNEARRIRAATQSRAWLFLTFSTDATTRALVDAVERAGGRRARSVVYPKVELYEYRFEPQGRAGGSRDAPSGRPSHYSP